MKMRVTLTATSNPYLREHTPLVGEIEIHEVGTDGSVIHASFRCEYLDGTLGAPVQVKEIQFRYGVAGEPMYPFGRKQLPKFRQHAGEESRQVWSEEERQTNRWR